MAQMSSTVGIVADYAVAAADAAKEADSQARNGQTVLDESVAAIRTIAGETEAMAAVVERAKND